MSEWIFPRSKSVWKQCLDTHMRIHTENPEKPFKCDICDAAFGKMGHLNRHKRIHTGEKPYKCDTCGAAYIQKSNLIGHIRIHTGEKPFKCEVCDHRFARKTDLNQHMRTHTKRAAICSS